MGAPSAELGGKTPLGWEDRSLAVSAVHALPEALEQVLPKEQGAEDDFTLCMEATMAWGPKALCLASPEMQERVLGDKRCLLQILLAGPASGRPEIWAKELFEMAPERLRADPDLTRAVISLDGRALGVAAEPLQRDRDMVRPPWATGSPWRR